QVPISAQYITPIKPGAGIRVASLYFQPFGSTPKISQTANPETNMCKIMVLMAIPMMPSPKISLENKVGIPAASNMAAACIGEILEEFSDNRPVPCMVV